MARPGLPADYLLLLSAPALVDIERILRWTTENFGAAGRKRYEVWIYTALSDLADDPARVGVRVRDDIGKADCTYHLSSSRKHTDIASQVAKPRHLILFRLDGKKLKVSRLLHDSMDFARHVSSE